MRWTPMLFFSGAAAPDPAGLILNAAEAARQQARSRAMAQLANRALSQVLLPRREARR